MQSPDHIRRGLAFIVGCMLIGVTLFALSRCSQQSDQDAENAMAMEVGCEGDAVALNLGRIEAKGTLQVLAPKADTDGYQQSVYELEGVQCLPREDLDALARGAGDGDNQAVTFLIGYDPKGRADSFRNRFDYEPDTVTAPSDMPSPPRDMNFGDVKWTVSANEDRFTVNWYADFAQWIAEQYGDISSADRNVASDTTDDLGTSTTTQCENSGMGEGSWLRDNDGQIIVLIDGECRYATPDEAEAILRDEATPDGE